MAPYKRLIFAFAPLSFYSEPWCPLALSVSASVKLHLFRVTFCLNSRTEVAIVIGYFGMDFWSHSQFCHPAHPGLFVARVVVLTQVVNHDAD